jgi:hypothetical protein
VGACQVSGILNLASTVSFACPHASNRATRLRRAELRRMAFPLWRSSYGVPDPSNPVSAIIVNETKQPANIAAMRRGICFASPAMPVSTAQQTDNVTVTATFARPVTWAVLSPASPPEARHPASAVAPGGLAEP